MQHFINSTSLYTTVLYIKTLPAIGDASLMEVLRFFHIITKEKEILCKKMGKTLLTEFKHYNIFR